MTEEVQAPEEVPEYLNVRQAAFIGVGAMVGGRRAVDLRERIASLMGQARAELVAIRSVADARQYPPERSRGGSLILRCLHIPPRSAGAGRAARAVLGGLDVGHQGVVGESGGLLVRAAGVPGGREKDLQRGAVAGDGRGVDARLGALNCRWPRAPAGRCHRRWPKGRWSGRRRPGGAGPAGGAGGRAGPGRAGYAWCSSISPALRARVPRRRGA